MRSVLRDAAVNFITDELIANEINFKDGYPRSLQLLIAHRLCENPAHGWPDLDSALAYLEDEFTWS